MFRRLLTIFALVSLLMCVATLGIWVRSACVEDAWSIFRSAPYGASGRGKRLLIVDINPFKSELQIDLVDLRLEDLPTGPSFYTSISNGWHFDHFPPLQFNRADGVTRLERMGFRCEH